MILGVICPVCKSKQVTQSELSHYEDKSYANEEFKVCVDWICGDCKAIYKAIYHGERFVITPYNQKIKDNDEALKYDVEM